MHRNTKMSERLKPPFLSVVDLLLILVAFGTALLIVVLLGIKLYVLPVEDIVNEKMIRLSEIDSSYSFVWELITAPGESRKFSHDTVISGLKQLNDSTHAVTQVTTHMLKRIVEEDWYFWTARARELCEPPPPVPQFYCEDDYLSELDELDNMAELARFQQAVWQIYEACKEESLVNIPESLLHFTSDRYDSFHPHMTEREVEEAFEKIMMYVDEHVFGKKQRKIYVRGHCDDLDTREYNYLLSFNRAYYVSMKIMEHLTKRGYREGEDYLLYMEGMGESRLLPKEEDENISSWRSRCRRIELAFQKMNPRRDLKW